MTAIFGFPAWVFGFFILVAAVEVFIWWSSTNDVFWREMPKERNGKAAEKV